ncbi:site-specific integrase [Actinoplanes sp. NPDC051346]|uniref:tyrosine-type recombinase/integrase n=1 Tax=Actinoplanes sp. NPDC051346 TaxID=3155048 RepID=UPI0034229118
MTTAVVGAPRRVDEVARLRSLLRAPFLLEAGWDPQTGVLAPPRQHRLLGLAQCQVVDCAGAVHQPNGALCRVCLDRYRDAGRPELSQFTATVSGKRNEAERPCRVGCQRPARTREHLCNTHYRNRQRFAQLTLQQWLARPQIRPLPSWGSCRVTGCPRLSSQRDGLCPPHLDRWLRHQRQHPDARLGAWICAGEPILGGHTVTLAGLPERFQVELLLAVQLRCDAGVKTRPTKLRRIVADAKTRRAGSIAELLAKSRRASRFDDVQATLRAMDRELRRALSTPERERPSDVWDLRVWGLRGTLDFTALTQRWLREAAKTWAMEDLPLHRGVQAGATARATLAALDRLSQTLRHSRDDAGEDPRVLSRRDVVAWLNRLAHQQHTGTLSEKNRVGVVRRVRRFLDDIRGLGVTGLGEPAEGLPADVMVRAADVPREPDSGRCRDLPPTVLQTLCEHLHLLQERSGINDRRTVELLIDTGRRPAEICRLPWDCLDRDADGNPVLVYTDFKNNRLGLRLPIAEATAQLIVDQKTLVQELFPHTPVGQLVLFPRDKANPDGTKPALHDSFAEAHRHWIDTLADKLIDRDGRPVDHATITAYAYRHTYAQRHADQGVPPDVLRDLLGHKTMRTTAGYYRVTETRVRGAVDRVARHQFDGHGRRVFHSIAKLLTDEHARLRVGQVAVPFGTCTEPSNVKASGQACPYKFTCLGCGHFRSDASYLPELKSYLQQLLADQERLRAAHDLDDWARQQLMPRTEEITQLRALIRRVEVDLADLSPADREQITTAIAVIRTARQHVNLGMPAIRPPTTGP